ncbi:mycofactocin-coupled SDR family oxidoreductase [Mycobacterium sp. 94-17]|uniref:mycofactocin-coupled SDR family oxidoreductase n=1 Tax=Mycobacterium sp. 94-17 TaxID=2986147 RepID=UPI002D1F25D5|nr:mycofactocin-coupled SDR family oxidoreductase [Mycobacterium sp. 94-17]MEB4211125.1 mycofactocin-coupled SDR family oxidoreductase [Mycobacterium sp. 94-17]
MAGKLEDKVAFITGAARGQGRSHAVRLADEGADIIAIDVPKHIVGLPYEPATAADLAETVRQVEALGRRIVAAEADVRDLAAMQAAVDAGVAELGRLDIVLANAGISAPAPTLDMSEEHWQTMIDINLTGVWKSLKASVPQIIEGGRGGSIVITSSLAAIIVQPNIAHYSAAKGGLIQLSKVLAKELAPQGIRVNTIHPGTVLTPMVLNEPSYRLFRPDLEHPTQEDFEEVARSMTGLPTSAIDPVDMSNAIVYLVSDDGRYVTGTSHVVSAGMF